MDKPMVAWPWYAPIGTVSTVMITLIINHSLRLKQEKRSSSPE
jgi:hypothetical protein